MKRDEHHCPDRGNAPMLKTLGHYDAWRGDTWRVSLRALVRGFIQELRWPSNRREPLIKRVRTRAPNWPATLWDWQPRTCSFCGGVHPDDLEHLVYELGWHFEPTDKHYKLYLEPPLGTRPLPVPPVKVYAWHTYSGQITRLLEAANHGKP